MPKFLTQYDTHERFVQPSGSGVKQLYSPTFDKRGVMSLEPSGEEDLYGYIQSHADSCDIHVILKRFEQGDLSVMQRVQGVYGDFTQMPKTFAEALNTLIAAEQYFDSLPVDVRAKFGHNFSQFIASMDSTSFAADIGLELPDPSAVAPASSTNIEDQQPNPSIPE